MYFLHTTETDRTLKWCWILGVRSQEAAESGKDDSEAGSLMSCLIENKFHEKMDEKCRAGIVHHQLVSRNARVPPS